MFESETIPVTRNSFVECSIADTPESREKVYRLRYECYRRKGSIDAKPDEQFSDAFDAQPNSFSFLAQGSANIPLATVRISVVRPDLGWTDSPVHHVFGDHPVLHGNDRKTFVEASRLCFGRQARRDSFVQLVGNMAALAEFFSAEWLVACPRVEHAPIYERLFGLQPLAAPRQYFGDNFKTLLLGVPTVALGEYVRDMLPMRNAWTRALTQLKKLSDAGQLVALKPS
jgi:hypothetical protein